VNSPIPSDNDYLYGYGVSSQGKDIATLRKSSKNAARNDLSESLQVRVKSELKNTISRQRTNQHESISDEVTSYIKTESDSFLIASEVIEMWLQPNSCNLWTKVRMDKKSIDESAKHISNSALHSLRQDLKNISKQLDNVKKETSDNPKKELANRGIPYTGEGFAQTAYRGDVENLALFLAAGMNFSDAVDPSWENFDEMLSRIKLENYKKVVELAQKTSNAELPTEYLLFNAIWHGNIEKLNVLVTNGIDYNQAFNQQRSSYSMHNVTLTSATPLCMASALVENAQKDYVKAKNLQEQIVGLKAIQSKLKKLKAATAGEVKISPKFLQFGGRDTRFNCNSNQLEVWNYSSNKFTTAS